MTEYIVFVPLPQEAPIPAEGIQAKLIDTDQYEIIGVPFVAYDIHKGDVVRATLEEDALVYQQHIRAGGHATVR
ncbi:MAG: hypothetical protein ACI9MC_003250, partial [Kiritimatiellia bacterium]